MLKSRSKNANAVLFASMLLMIVFGSVHAFSVFLLPMESHFQASRSAVSLIYSLSLVTLTFSVFLGHRIYGLVRPSYFVLSFCLLAFLGVILTALATKLSLAYLGFGLIFGFANGLAYGFALHICAQTNEKNKGLAIGLVTASYALGPVLAPWPLTRIIETFGLTGGLMSYAITILLVMPIAVFAFHLSGVRLHLNKIEQPKQPSQKDENSPRSQKKQTKKQMKMLWISYGLAVTAGLMTIGHATGIATTGGISLTLIVIAPIIIALFNMVGSLLGGWMADHFNARTILCALPLLSAVSMLALSQFLSNNSILVGLALVGFTYGAIIAAYPAVISTLFGAINAIRIYGIIFTAWGAAGFLGPWLAGSFYDNLGDYKIALIIAALAGVLSATVAFFAIEE